MSKLIGTNPNQVPSNADLGTAAFMDKKDFLLSKGSSLSAIDAVIPNTAVDVFIYDTSKDSDGGAWRKRTQHTSWYNERLNTTTRGSRKEFPSVAVIVAESTQVTIYDGDDPSMPMWMVFNRGTGSWPNVTAMLMASSGASATASCVTMLNGTIFVGAVDNTNSNPYSTRVNFLEEKFTNSGAAKYTFSNTIAERNSTTIAPLQYSPELVNKFVNDVAMTVLPNAPIDSATGLPVPTIAVATNGGTSVIKDDGTIGTLTGFSPVTGVTINSTTLAIYSDSGSTGYLAVGSSTVATGSADYNSGWRTNWSYEDNISGTPTALLGETATFGGFGTSNEIHAAGDDGYNIFLPSVGETQDAIAYIASDYNTGWMVGDTKLATLSDTDTTNAVGTELIANSTSFSNTTGWYLDNANASSGTIATIAASGGNLVFTHSNTNNVWDGFGTSGTFVVGQTYTIDTTIVSATNINVLRITTTSNQHAADIATTINSAGTHSYTFTATATTMYFHWNGFYTTSTITLSKFSVRLAEEDRSVNGNGLQVFGTVKKTPVASGADLVAYSGFSSSSPYNSLQQPYNSDFDFTGDFSAMLWVYLIDTGAGTRIFFDRVASGWPTPPARFFFGIDNSDYLYYYVQDSNGASTGNTAKVLQSGIWNHCCFVRRGRAHEIYLNGILQTSQDKDIRDTTQTGATLTLGNAFGFGNPFDGSLALARISATIPTEEQIKKIYNDEKHLFQENAKATLYGTSDAVTALAYDDDTELLHVGTSAGRSDFQGLRRINNTTRAIGTAISAVDGFIVEE